MPTKEKNYWISAGKITLLERMCVLIFGLLTFICLVRVLPEEDYGTWMLFISLATLLETIRNGFFKNPLIRALNIEDNTDKSILQSSSLIMNVVFSLAISMSLVLLSDPISSVWKSPQLVDLLHIFVPTSLFLAFFFHFDYIQRAKLKFFGPFLGYAFKNGLLFVAVFFHFIMDFPLDLTRLAIYYSCSALVGTGISYLYAKNVFRLTFKYNRAYSSALLAYGKYTLGTNISAVLLRNVDIWMIGWYLNPASIAVYNVAIRIANLFEVPSMALASILFPEAVKRAEKEGDSAVKKLYEKSVAAILLFSVPMVIVIIIFSNQIVELIAGKAYSEAGMILNITMLYGLFIPFNKQMGVVLDAVGKAKINMLFVIRNALINVVLNAIYIPIWGVTGAALATLTTMLLVLFINQIYLRRNYQISLKELFTNYFVFHKKVFSIVKSRF